MDDDDEDFQEELREFVEQEALEAAEFDDLCSSLRRNDPTITVVNHLPARPYGRGPALGRALSGNTCVQHLCLPVEIACNSDWIFDIRTIQGLLSYVRQSTTLRIFHLKAVGISEPETLDTIELWMDAVASNEHIEEFIIYPLWRRPLPSLAALRLFENRSRSLKRFRLKASQVSDHERHFHAIGNMTALEAMDFYDFDMTRLPESANMIRSLPIPPSLFQVALGLSDRNVVVTPMTLIEAVASFISAPSSRQIKEFSVSLNFNEEGMQCFVAGLQQSQSVTKLTLLESSFTDEAIDAFVTYMQETNGVLSTSVITSLIIRGCELPLARLMTMTGPRGSALVSLEGKDTTRWREDWESLVECQSPHLKSLKIVHIYTDGNGVPFQHISNLVYLQELDLSYIVFNDRHVNLTELFGAVKSNGSLHSVRPHDLCRSLWSPNQARLVEAYSQRNRLLPALIKSSAADVAKDDEMNSTDSCSEENSTAIPLAAIPEPEVIAQHSMLPVLCLAALGTPRMTAQHFFTGTVALDDSIRPVPHSTLPQSSSLNVSSW